jgi:DNA repair protein RadA/Sms
VEETRPASAPLRDASRPIPISELPSAGAPPRPTGIEELDRVLGGGLVPGSVTVIGGEPGIGKSTLLLQALGAMADAGRSGLLVSAEESAAQVRARAERLGMLSPNLQLQSETALPHIVAGIGIAAPDVCVVDSIQTVFDPDLSSSAGSVLQVRECAAALTRVAKERGMACLLVGHVTKDGTLAGPRVLEHLVDTVLAFEGERHHSLRLLRAVKHRYGATGELGLFEMADCGLVSVTDPGSLLLGDRRTGTPGSVVVPALEGRRPLLVEVQALVSASNLPQPRRSAQGLDAGRLALLLAVLGRHARLEADKRDVYVSAVGGVRIAEPAADLGVALALASAIRDRPVPPEVVACGEIGLGGEIRQVHQMARRLAEAARLGFRRAIVPISAPDGPAGITLERVSTVSEAVAVALAGERAPSPEPLRRPNAPAIFSVG